MQQKNRLSLSLPVGVKQVSICAHYHIMRICPGPKNGRPGIMTQLCLVAHKGHDSSLHPYHLWTQELNIATINVLLWLGQILGKPDF